MDRQILLHFDSIKTDKIVKASLRWKHHSDGKKSWYSATKCWRSDGAWGKIVAKAVANQVQENLHCHELIDLDNLDIDV